MEEIQRKALKEFAMRLPRWFLKPTPEDGQLPRVSRILSRLKLHTVCQSAQCPNLQRCFSGGLATFMLMGDICTRNCRFCAVAGGNPRFLDPTEPARIARATKALGLNHVVVTSVTRDDLPDGGAGHFAQTIHAIRDSSPTTSIEVLVPDFKGSEAAVETVIDARPDVFNHNVETVPRLYPAVRPHAKYYRSLKVLYMVKARDHRILTKSGLMLGLGETAEELADVMINLRLVSCDMLTMGQYLSPSEDHVPIDRFVSPEEFEDFAGKAKRMGFKGVASGPLVRSSYKAEQLFIDAQSS